MSRKTHRNTLILITPYSAITGSKTSAAAPVGAAVEMTNIKNDIRCISSLNTSCDFNIKKNDKLQGRKFLGGKTVSLMSN